MTHWRTPKEPERFYFGRSASWFAREFLTPFVICAFVVAVVKLSEKIG